MRKEDLTQENLSGLGSVAAPPKANQTFLKNARGSAMHINTNSDMPQGGNSAPAQRARLMCHLAKHKSVNTFEAREFLSIQQPAARIMELKEAGLMFITVRERATCATGSTHNNIARYVLMGFRPKKMTQEQYDSLMQGGLHE